MSDELDSCWRKERRSCSIWDLWATYLINLGHMSDELEQLRTCERVTRPSWPQESRTWSILDVWATNLIDFIPMSSELRQDGTYERRRTIIFWPMSDELDQSWTHEWWRRSILGRHDSFSPSTLPTASLTNKIRALPPEYDMSTLGHSP